MNLDEYMTRRAARIARGGMTNEQFLARLREYEAEQRARRIELVVDVALLTIVILITFGIALTAW